MFLSAQTSHVIRRASGFTLIELSIVLVIIGLIVGGVLTGRDLIKAAEIRKTVKQLEQFDAAINTFYGKYNVLPGDATPANAAEFGFVSRLGGLGSGDGDGFIASAFVNDGNEIDGTGEQSPYDTAYGHGGDESQLFFVDLEKAGLIAYGLNASDPSTAHVEKVLPRAAVEGAFIVAANGGIGNRSPEPFGYTFMGYPPGGPMVFSPPAAFAPLGNNSAFGIDSKIDDGNAITGTVYTLTMVPEFGASPYRGVFPGCSSDTGVYDVADDQPNACTLKVRGNLP